MYDLIADGEMIEITMNGEGTVTTKQIERKGGRLYMRTKKRQVDPVL